MNSDIPFINRNKDIEIISEILNKNISKGTILLIAARTGVGKTSLLDKILQDYRRHPVVHVKVVDHPGYSAEEGDYIHRIYRAIADTAQHDTRLPNFKSFQDNLKKKKTTKKITKGFVNHIGGKFIGNDTVDAITDLVNTDPVKYPNSQEAELELYGLDVLESCPCVVRIENFQKIDSKSLEMTSRFLQINQKVFGIFEYTEETHNGIPIETIQTTFQHRAIHFLAYRLSVIDPEEIFNNLKCNQDIMFAAFKRHYTAQNGNLRIIVDLNVWVNQSDSSQRSRKKIISSSDLVTTRAILRSLDNPKRFVLALIAVHRAEIEIDILLAAVKALPDQQVQELGIIDLQGILKALHEIKYLKLDGTRVLIAHDSITDVYMADFLNKKFVLIANDIWINFYKMIIDTGDPFIPHHEALHWLALFFSATDRITNLMWVLEMCGQAALQSLAPRRVVSLFDQIIRSANHSSSQISLSHLDRLIEYQGEILYDANWVDEVW